MLLENNPYPQDPRVTWEARALAAAGYHVSVICPVGGQQPWHEALDGVQVYRFPAPPPVNGFLGYIWEYGYSMLAMYLVSLLVFIREGFDIVHTANPPDTLVFIAAFYKLLGKWFVYDHHDLAPEMYYARFGGKGNRPVYRILLLLERISCQIADHVITTNQSYKTVEMQRDHVLEERITVVRNGPAMRSGQLETSHLGRQLQGEKTIIGYVGVLGFQDGVDYLLRALHHLVSDLGRTDFLCIIVGDGDAYTSLKLLATKLGLDENVQFTGWVSDVDDITSYLSTADICVVPDPSNPYHDRSTMVKMMEYMALGKPIVAFDLLEHRVTAHLAAVYARPNDEFDFAKKIAWLMDDPERRKRVGQVGRERIEAGLARSYQEKYLLEAYKSLTRGLPSRRSGAKI